MEAEKEKEQTTNERKNAVVVCIVVVFFVHVAPQKMTWLCFIWLELRNSMQLY